jgi:hypothetical protein
MNLTEKQRHRLFGKIVSLVETKYYDRTFGGHNWQELEESKQAFRMTPSP